MTKIGRERINMVKMKKGFSLAEVLITMGVLGVVAALTMPALMTDVNRNTWAQGLKTNMSVINNGFAQMLAVENADTLDETTLWVDHVSSDVAAANQDVKSELGKYFKIDKMITGVPADRPVVTLQAATSNAMDSTVRFYLPNSATMNMVLYAPTVNAGCKTIMDNGGNLCEKYADIYLDVNGDKRPNMFGHDIFRFYLSRNGKIYPYGGDDVALFESGAPKWSEACEGKSPSGDGLACTGRVVAEDFKIDYK